jgi:enoyl-CoA hydratase
VPPAGAPAFRTLALDGPDRDGILTVTLDRPGRLNALTRISFDELHQLCGWLRGATEVRVVVLTGAGRGFCAGLDLDEAAGLPAMGVTEMYARQQHGAAAVAALHAVPQPVVAAVNGPAAGGGLALALVADVRIASTTARFGVAFVRLGLSGCDVGVSWLLPRIVGLGHATELMLTGRVIGAERAEAIGLVSRVVGGDELLAVGRAVAGEMAANSPFGLRLTKEGLRLAVDAPSLDAAIALENRNQVLASRTDDMARAVGAFVTSTRPAFTGT